MLSMVRRCHCQIGAARTDVWVMLCFCAFMYSFRIPLRMSLISIYCFFPIRTHSEQVAIAMLECQRHYQPQFAMCWRMMKSEWAYYYPICFSTQRRPPTNAADSIMRTQTPNRDRQCEKLSVAIGLFVFVHIVDVFGRFSIFPFFSHSVWVELICFLSSRCGICGATRLSTTQKPKEQFRADISLNLRHPQLFLLHIQARRRRNRLPFIIEFGRILVFIRTSAQSMSIGDHNVVLDRKLSDG